MIAVPKYLEQPFQEIAEMEHKPVDEFLEQTLVEFIEDYHDARLAEQAIKEVRNGEDNVLSLTAARKLYDELVDSN